MIFWTFIYLSFGLAAVLYACAIMLLIMNKNVVVKDLRELSFYFMSGPFGLVLVIVMSVVMGVLYFYRTI